MTSPKLSALLPRNGFRTALAAVVGATEKRNHLPILSHALISASPAGTFIRTTDLDLQVTATIPDTVADGGFALTLPVHALRDFEKKAPMTEHVAIDTVLPSPEPESEETQRKPVAKPLARAALDFEGLRVAMETLPISDFPELTIEGHIQASFTLPTTDLRAALEAVQFAISTEETRYYLNGVFMHPTSRGEALRFVATDGHRMATYDIPLPNGAAGSWGVIIPRKTVAFLLSQMKAKGAAETMAVLVNTSKARFTLGHIDVLTKLVDGTYPDYQRVIPRGNDKLVRLDRAEVLKAIGAVSVISTERGRAVRFDIEAGKLTLSASHPETGTASMDIPCDYDGTPLQTGFNAKYLGDILKELTSDVITLKLADPGSPALFIEHDGAPSLYVLMPVRI